MKKLFVFVLMLWFVVGSDVIQGQERQSKKERRREQAVQVERIMEGQDYKFVAQRALPMTGRSIHLNSEYDLHVSKDVISAHLPYFGRVYTAPVDPTEGGIKFESRDFEYSIENAKKGGWIAHITVRDTKHFIKMTLTITTSGLAMLSVSDNTRQSISFNGYLDGRKDK